MTEELKNTNKWVDCAVFLFIFMIVSGILLVLATWISTESMHPIAYVLVGFVSGWIAWACVQSPPSEVIDSFKKF